jgi:peptidoglycan/xylan/chitin deacetylase (PgdA/CDA1 family)
MRASDAETWKREGMQFASHSESHPHLAELQDAELEHELLQSRDELAAVVGEKVHSFVYPFGEYNQRVAARTSEHYALAFTLNVGLNSIATPRHELRRLIISKDDSCIDLWFCTKFGRSPLRTLRKMLRK